MSEKVAVVESKRRRATGTVVTVYRAVEAGLDPESGPYVTMCEDHGQGVGHETVALARFHAVVGGGCEICEWRQNGMVHDDDPEHPDNRQDETPEPIERPQSPRYEQNQYNDRTGFEPCLICGKGVKHQDTVVIYDPTTNLLMAQPEFEKIEREGLRSPGNYPGLHPIGRDCLKKHPEVLPFLYVDDDPDGNFDDLDKLSA